MNYSENDYRNYLSHHGIKGQKWGVRRFQNEDGTLTDLGKKAYRYHSTYDRTIEDRIRKGPIGDYADKVRKESQSDIKSNVSNRRLKKRLEKIVKQELTSSYQKAGAKKLESVTGNDYFKLINQIEDRAYANAAKRISQDFGDLTAEQKRYLKKKGSVNLSRTVTRNLK